jgi:Fur family transcriptional regulator, iron response regulator
MEATTATPWKESAAEVFEAVERDLAAEPALRPGEENLDSHGSIELLRRAGLRPTRQRMTLCQLLFSNGGRHVTADVIYTAAAEAGMQMSRATVYNTLHQLTDAGLLRQIGVDGSKSYFDSNPTAHHHFFVDQEDRLFDVPAPGVAIDTLPQPLPGYEIAGVDVVVHLRRRQQG